MSPITNSWFQSQKEKPPPPGDSITSLSPTFIGPLLLPPMFSAIPPSLIRRFLPVSPGWPPSSPYGRRQRLSLSILITNGRRGSISRITPSPPLCIPAPPLPGLKLKRLNSTGYRRSNISGSVIRVFVQ